MLSQYNLATKAGRAILSRLSKNKIKLAETIRQSSGVTSVNDPSYDHLSTSKLFPSIRYQHTLSELLAKSNKYPLNTKLQRDELTLKFRVLSSHLLDGSIKIEDLMESEEFSDVQQQTLMQIDSFSDSQLTNILSSLIRMRFKPDNPLLRQLELEVKFRVKDYSFKYVNKIMNFYKSAGVAIDHKHLYQALSQRLKALFQDPDQELSLKDCNSILRLVQSGFLPVSWNGIVDEYLLNLLNYSETINAAIEKYADCSSRIDYNSLCHLFQLLAEGQRRPTPVMKLAAREFCKLPSPSKDDIDPITLIATMNSLTSLNYKNYKLLSKLIKDLTDIIECDKLTNQDRCSLLFNLGCLRWRSTNIIDKMCEYIISNKEEQNVDHNFVSTLFHTLSLLDYRPTYLDDIYKTFVTQELESKLSSNPRIWLNYVWALEYLGLSEPSHIKSVLQKTFFNNIFPDESLVIETPDIMKILNLRAIAILEKKAGRLDLKHFGKLEKVEQVRNAILERFHTRVCQALTGIIDNPQDYQARTHTSFGFVVDFELWLNDQLDFVPIDPNKSLSAIDFMAKKSDIKPFQKCTDHHKCAIICITFNDAILNSQDDVIGHKKIISRILDSLGYKTVFLNEAKLSKLDNSSEFVDVIRDELKKCLVPR